MSASDPNSLTSAGRLMRFDPGIDHSAGSQVPDGAGRWRPVGEPLPPFRHAPPAPNLEVAPWVLPRDLAPRTGDVIVVGELAHLLLSRCPPDDQAYDDLIQQSLLFASSEEVMAWLAEIEVWVGYKLRPGKPWPEPAR